MKLHRVAPLPGLKKLTLGVLVNLSPLGLLLYLSLCFSSVAVSADATSPLEAIRAVDKEGQGHEAALRAAGTLQQWDAERLPEVLAAMDGANPLAVNWLRGIVEAIAGRAERAGKQLPLDALEQFLAETSHHPRARRLAYELIVKHDPEAEKRLVPGWVQDPSLELRRDAITWVTQRADKARQESRQDEAVRLYHEAFAAARDIDQVQSLAKTLKELNEKVDPARQLGFVRSWYVIGPFDNTGKQGFDVAYPPESELDLEKKYPGKEGEFAWKPTTTEDEYGVVDLNAALGKHKGAIAYAWAEFTVEKPRDVELRLGSINGNKVWLNGELLTANHVYHANMFIDQYVGRGRLKAGPNQILVKIAQNEQNEPWAQDWKFQLRVCDEIGTAIPSAEASTDKVSARIRLTR